MTAHFEPGGEPEVRNPWTGLISSLGSFSLSGGSGRVHLDVTPYGSKPLVFNPNQESSTGEGSELRATPSPVHSEAVGTAGWSVHATCLGPEGTPVILDLQMTKLLDWRDADSLKEFSGRRTYQTHFTVTRKMLGNDKKLLLNLGEVRDVAEINLNGSAGPTLVMLPYEADITGLVKPGENLLEVTIVNSLKNAKLPRMFRMGRTTLMRQMQEAMREKLLTSQSSGLLGLVILSVQG